MASTIKSKNGEWWFSDIERDSDILLLFRIPKDKLPKPSELDNIIKHVQYTKWPLNEHTGCYDLGINIMTNFDIYSTIPYSNINEIISALDKYDTIFDKMHINFFNDNIDLTSLNKLPRELEISSCFCRILTIPHNTVIKKISITGTPRNVKTKELTTIKIPMKNIPNLRDLSVIGSYTLHDSVCNDFKYLKHLEELHISGDGIRSDSHKLPHLEYCTRLRCSTILTKYLPKHLRSIEYPYQNTLTTLCRKLRKSPITRLIDITLGMWSLRLPNYIILWITDCLPASDWYSDELVKLYKGAKLPSLDEWGIKEFQKIRIIESINVNRPSLRQP